jgi:hypothetical protein
MLAGGTSPVADVTVEVSEDEVTDMLDQAKERWKEPHPIPRWLCDGIHCAGNDTRFAGILPNMYAVAAPSIILGAFTPMTNGSPSSGVSTAW